MFINCVDNYAELEDGPTSFNAGHLLRRICNDPLLVSAQLNVDFFVLMQNYSIIGIQSFKGSFRRQCVLSEVHGCRLLCY
jgi:hypothetical protein